MAKLGSGVKGADQYRTDAEEGGDWREVFKCTEATHGQKKRRPVCMAERWQGPPWSIIGQLAGL